MRHYTLEYPTFHSAAYLADCVHALLNLDALTASERDRLQLDLKALIYASGDLLFLPDVEERIYAAVEADIRAILERLEERAER